MSEQRADTLPPSFLQDSKLLLKTLDKLAKDLLCQQRQEQFSKKSMTIYMNTFAFEAGFNPPNEQELNTLYFYLEDPKKQNINKNKFMSFLKKCVQLYVESKRQPIGGMIDRLILMLKAQALRDKEKEIESRYN